MIITTYFALFTALCKTRKKESSTLKFFLNYIKYYETNKNQLQGEKKIFEIQKRYSYLIVKTYIPVFKQVKKKSMSPLTYLKKSTSPSSMPQVIVTSWRTWSQVPHRLTVASGVGEFVSVLLQSQLLDKIYSFPSFPIELSRLSLWTRSNFWISQKNQKQALYSLWKSQEAKPRKREIRHQENKLPWESQGCLTSNPRNLIPKTKELK